jgi:Flp pilus assembly protein TadG
MLRPSACRRERGQAAILTIVSLTTLIGMVALVIDVGVWRSERGHMQNAADAAALAAASYLPDQAAKADSIAHATAIANGASSADVTFDQTDPTSSGYDTVTVRTHAPGTPYFAKLFGIGGFDINTQATALAQSYTSIKSNSMAPIALMRDDAQSYGFGQEFPAKLGDSSGGNFGAIQLPVEQAGCDAFALTGASEWKSLMAGNVYDVCDVSVGQPLPVKPGAMAGPTDDLSIRIGSNTQGFFDVVQPDPNGGFSKLLDPTCPRIVVMPMVVNADTGDSSWPSGSGTVRVVAFALVYIVDWNTPSPGQVNAIMIQTYTSYPGGVLGGVNSGSGTQHVKLVS